MSQFWYTMSWIWLKFVWLVLQQTAIATANHIQLHHDSTRFSLFLLSLLVIVHHIKWNLFNEFRIIFSYRSIHGYNVILVHSLVYIYWIDWRMRFGFFGVETLDRTRASRICQSEFHRFVWISFHSTFFLSIKSNSSELYHRRSY